jgi:esterase/lipase superfamily enzyme
MKSSRTPLLLALIVATGLLAAGSGKARAGGSSLGEKVLTVISNMAEVVLRPQEQPQAYSQAASGAAPKDRPSDCEELNGGAAACEEQIEIFYVTNRLKVDERPTYGDTDDESRLHFGLAHLRVRFDPDKGTFLRTRGIIGKGSVVASQDDIRIGVMKELNEGDFYSTVLDETQRMRQHQVLVYVHGFNTDFDDAIKVSAKIAHNIKYNGPIVLFSWPAYPSISPYGYMLQSDAAEHSGSRFEEFLGSLMARPEINQVDLIAHSLGSHLLISVLHHAEADTEQMPKLGEIVFAAPDYDRTRFRDKIRDFLASYRKANNGHSARMTLYASSKDHALYLSWNIHGYDRAGDTTNGIVTLVGLDSIDATQVATADDVFGHNYYTKSPGVIADMYGLFSGHYDPRERPFLQQSAPPPPLSVRAWMITNTLNSLTELLKIEKLHEQRTTTAHGPPPEQASVDSPR